MIGACDWLKLRRVHALIVGGRRCSEFQLPPSSRGIRCKVCELIFAGVIEEALAG